MLKINSATQSLYIPGFVPAVFSDALSGFGFILPIFQHDTVTSDHKLSWSSKRNNVSCCRINHFCLKGKQNLQSLLTKNEIFKSGCHFVKQESRDLFVYLSVMANTSNSFCLSLHVVNWEATEGHWTVLSCTIPNLFQHNNISSYIFKYCVEGMQDHTELITLSIKQGFLSGF